MKKLTIEDARKVAEERGGRCLSSKFINSKTPLKWQCKNGHNWEACIGNIKRGTWCPQCARPNNKLSINDMYNIASERDGEFLSPFYKNSTTKHKWKCKNGHVFLMRPADIKHRNCWCPKCAGVKKLTIEEMHQLAEERGGKCLSTEYINGSTPLKWECSKSHIWESKPANIKQGRWCPKCAGRTKLTIEDMHNLAHERGGKCLSNTYVKSSLKLKWQCSDGHIWESTPSNIRGGSWCPDCHGYSNEKKCRLIFRELFGKDFPKNRKILGEKLELDGYNKELNLAFEYQGKQHYEYIPYFHQNSEEKFKERIEVDRKKAQLCNEKGINLIVIPYFMNKSDRDFIDFIKNEITKLGIKITNDLEDISLNAFYKDFAALQEIKELARSKGGKCLSNEYTDNMSMLKFQCAKGHVWETRAITFKHDDTWCPKCAINSRKTIEDMYRLAQERGGKFLSTTFTTVVDHYNWQCAEGHVWTSTASNISQGRWCPVCSKTKRKPKVLKNARTKLTIEDMYKIARERGGICLSDSYINGDIKLKWRCSKGHIWETKPANIRQGSWCPECNGNKNYTIRDMEKLAEARGGKCLSGKYKNNNTPLIWQCSQEHTWKATPSNIKKGSWCPVCARRAKINIHDMHQLAQERGGKCLSDKYINTSTKLKWQCLNGHMWEARPASIKRNNSWCPICSKPTIEDMHQLAQGRGGKCLSGKYINSTTHLTWQCSEGHTWNATPDNVKWGSWCPKCAKNSRKTIEDMYKIAEEHGGKCLSTKYKNSNTPLKWECAKGHTWETKPNTIINGTWCPKCAKNSRKTIEDMNIIAEKHGGKFLSPQFTHVKDYFDWECSKGHTWKSTASNILIGSWCPTCVGKINRAGQRKTKITIEDLTQLALERGGKCLSDKYINRSIKLKWQCSEGHLWETAAANILQGSWCPKCAGKAKLTIEDMGKMAEERGGKCLSDYYVNSATHLKWQCSKGHIWDATPDNVKWGGNWCPTCAGKVKVTIEDMHELARNRGGKCLSNKYINSKTPLEWECLQGHTWYTAPSNIKKGTWCPLCSGKVKQTIEDMHELAKKHDGKCLSSIYFNNKTPLKWQCSKGHIWDAIPKTIKKAWCPICAKALKKNVSFES